MGRCSLCAILLVFFMSGRRGSLKRRLDGQGNNPPIAEPKAAAVPPTKLLCGGVRQRVVSADSECHGNSTSSSSADLPLTHVLKRNWCLGKASSPDVQEYALAAAQQGLPLKIFKMVHKGMVIDASSASVPIAMS